ncbi:MAG TPA: sel1 repeat family protein [Gammaproteobacteria bacterium]|nr:sel1 repeat family protein [Gammaproteobacteria bacterium]
MKKGILLAASMALAIFGGSLQAEDYNEGFLAAEAGDYVTAVAKWQPLAESGDANAQFNMALIYHKGLGVAADEARAVGWYHRAADNGSQYAQEFLSAAYDQGWFGLPQNSRLAQYWEARLNQ